MSHPSISKSVELPAVVTIYPTNHCFKACSHCIFVMDGSLNSRHLDFQLLKKVIKDLADSKVALVGVAGGDPILYPHFNELIQEIVAHRMFPILTLSGAGLNEEKIKSLSRLGVRSVQLSLDGGIAKTHDKIRGDGSFSETVSAIKRLNDENISVSLATCIHHENYLEFEAFLKLASGIGVDKIKVQRWRSVNVPNTRSVQEISWEQFEALKNQQIPNDLEVVFEKQSHQTKEKNNSLAILASGDLVLSEFAKPFGNIHSYLPSHYYRESSHGEN